MVYGTDLENASTWTLGQENAALTSINNVVSDGTTGLISCLDYYFTTDNGSTLTQHNNSNHYYYDYLDGKFIRYYKNSLVEYNLWYSDDLKKTY